MKNKGNILGFKIAVTFYNVLIILGILSFVLIILIDVLHTTQTNEIIGTVKLTSISTDTNNQILSNNSHITLTPYDTHAIYSIKDSDNRASILAYKIFYNIVSYLEILFFIYLLIQFKNLTKSVGKTKLQTGNYDVFSSKNLRCMRRICYAFFIYPILELFTRFLDNIFLTKYISVVNYKVSPSVSFADISWDYIIIGILLLSAVEIIRKGIALKNENDLTI